MATSAPALGAPLRWGILGTGAIARSFAQDMKDNGHRIVAVGARRQASADEFGQRFEIPRTHGSYDALVHDEDVDVVYVATLNPLHEEHAMLALRAGRNVLLEKPFALDVDSAEAIFRCAEENGVLAMEALWTRYLPHMQRLRELLASRAVGDVRAVTIDISQSLSTDPTNRLNDPSAGGGALYDLGPYAFTLVIDTVGAPVRVDAQGRVTSSGVDAQFSALATSASGAQAVVTAAIDLPGRLECSIVGDLGRIDIAAAWHRPSRLTVTTSGGIRRHRPTVTGRGMQYEAAAMERLVATGDGPARDSRDVTLAVLRSMDAVRPQLLESTGSGRGSSQLR